MLFPATNHPGPTDSRKIQVDWQAVLNAEYAVCGSVARLVMFPFLLVQDTKGWHEEDRRQSIELIAPHPGFLSGEGKVTDASDYADSAFYVGVGLFFPSSKPLSCTDDPVPAH